MFLMTIFHWTLLDSSGNLQDIILFDFLLFWNHSPELFIILLFGFFQTLHFIYLLFVVFGIPQRLQYKFGVLFLSFPLVLSIEIFQVLSNILNINTGLFPLRICIAGQSLWKFWEFEGSFGVIAHIWVKTNFLLFKAPGCAVVHSFEPELFGILNYCISLIDAALHFGNYLIPNCEGRLFFTAPEVFTFIAESIEKLALVIETSKILLFNRSFIVCLFDSLANLEGFLLLKIQWF